MVNTASMRPPPICRCCGTPCPVLAVWGEGNERDWFYECLVCPWGLANADRVYIEALHGPDGWTDKNIPDTKELSRIIATAWDVDEDDPDRPAAGTRAWVRRFLLDAARLPARHPDIPSPPSCQKSRYHRTSCGARPNDTDLRATPAWQDLVLELRRADLLDLPDDRLATLPPDPAAAPLGMFLEPRMEGMGQQEPLACVFMDNGPGAYLYVDPFTGTARFQSNEPGPAAAAWTLYRDWAASVDDPVLTVVGRAVRDLARYRFERSPFTNAHRYLVAALLPEGAARQTALALIRSGTDLTPAELAVRAADAADDPTLAARWAEPARVWPDVVPVEDWVAWEV